MNSYGQTYQLGFGGGLTPAIKNLLIANVVVFLLQQLLLPGWFVAWLALRPDLLLENFAFWQFFTYMFLHGGLWHLLFNLLTLWMFGCELERTWGSREFTIFYFVCGIGAGLIQAMASAFQPGHISVIGASGAIFGVLVAFAMVFPNRVITMLLFFVLPVQLKAKYLVMIWAAITLFLSIDGAQDGVAHFAHLGGMLVGFLYLKLNWRWTATGIKVRGIESYSNQPSTSHSPGVFSKIQNWFRQQGDERRRMEIVRRRQDEMQLREKVDVILDKINEVGYDNLTEEEKQILHRASQKLKQEKSPPYDYGPN